MTLYIHQRPCVRFSSQQTRNLFASIEVRGKYSKQLFSCVLNRFFPTITAFDFAHNQPIYVIASERMGKRRTVFPLRQVISDSIFFNLLPITAICIGPFTRAVYRLSLEFSNRYVVSHLRRMTKYLNDCSLDFKFYCRRTKTYVTKWQE